MKRLMIGAAVLALAGCEAKEAPKAEAPPAKWTHIRYRDGVHFFVTQPTEVDRQARIWMSSVGTSGDAVRRIEATALYEADCKEQRGRFLEHSAYDAEGEPIDLPVDEGEFIYPTPDSVLYKIMEMACGREPITGPGFDTIKQAKASETLKEIAAAEAAE